MILAYNRIYIGGYEYMLNGIYIRMYPISDTLVPAPLAEIKDDIL